jgi:hypothetical protein
MTYVQAAAASFAMMRQFYTGFSRDKDGEKLESPAKVLYKSSNKIILPANSPYANYERIETLTGENAQDDRHKKRREMAEECRKNSTTASYSLWSAETLYKTPPDAMNCAELALIAAWVAYLYLEKPKPTPTVVVSLTNHDHEFCAVGAPDKLTKIDGVTVNQLAKKIASADVVWAVDPWLNVCCHMRDYAEWAKYQLGIWQRKNKRLFFEGTLGKGYYAPTGEYREKFMAATLKVNEL